MNEQLNVEATKAKAIATVTALGDKSKQDPVATMVKAFGDNPEKTEIDMAFDWLSQEEQQVLRGRYMAGQSATDISKVTGMTEDHINQLADKALMGFANRYQGGKQQVFFKED